MTEPSDGLTFDNYMRATVLNGNAEFAQLIFQLMSAIVVIASLRLTHNDNHLGNAFIDAKPSVDDMHYIYKTAVDKLRIFTLPAQTKIVKLYDWDRSHADSLGSNKLSKDLQIRNSDDVYYQNKDMIKFICGLLAVPTFPVDAATSVKTGYIVGGGIPIQLKALLVKSLVRGTDDVLANFYNKIVSGGPNCFFNDASWDNFYNRVEIRGPERVLFKYAEYMAVNIPESDTPSTDDNYLKNAYYLDPTFFNPQGGFVIGLTPFPVAQAAMEDALKRKKQAQQVAQAQAQQVAQAQAQQVAQAQAQQVAQAQVPLDLMDTN